MINASGIKDKEVVNIHNGRKMGIVNDVEIDFEKGKILSIVILGSNKFSNLFGKSGDIIIPWLNVKKVGNDVIIVDINDEIDKNKYKEI